EGKAIAGVRVLIRRVHAGAADFHFDRITAADGTFEVRSLLPGRYTIEIDPRTVPDAIFPAVPKLVFADVAAESGAEVALAVERDAQGVRRTARNRKK
ncbi:MAG TPA: carboxypeptidase-like regulatory domain-containing protein, partial [Pyrinomonadaceae bacterium]|nr:carboxypeptidase-like regulatory domain-containing protein [Pyrinomonadaceae bacterium]